MTTGLAFAKRKCCCIAGSTTDRCKSAGRPGGEFESFENASTGYLMLVNFLHTVRGFP